ncbi:uncharacterized protein [Lolium perenne]|uniref:uncharacterized protein isoform X5 n=1 Tax=Lolium perenne TaxID=4522 RepID=UPI003A9A3275
MRAQRRRPPPSPSPGHSGSSAAIRRLPGPPMPCRFCPHLCLEFVFCSRWLVSWWSAFCLCEEAASANDCGKDYPCKMTMCVYLLFRGVAKEIAVKSCNALLLKVLWLGKPILIVEDCETHESMHGYPRIGWVLPAYLCKVNFTIFIKLDTSRIYNMCPTLAPSFDLIMSAMMLPLEYFDAFKLQIYFYGLIF